MTYGMSLKHVQSYIIIVTRVSKPGRGVNIHSRYVIPTVYHTYIKKIYPTSKYLKC